MKGMVSTKKMQMQLRISKIYYEKQVVEMMIHQESIKLLRLVLHSVDLVPPIEVIFKAI